MIESTSSNTPESASNQCPICNSTFTAEVPSAGDVPCSSCRQLLQWFQNDSRILQSFFESESSPLDGDSKFLSLGMDSLDVMELIMEIEEEFGVSIPDANYDQIQTVNDSIRIIQNQRQPVGADEDTTMD